MEIQHFIVHKQRHTLKRFAEGAWDGVQKRCAGVFRSVYCEAVLMGLVIVSFVLVVMEADFGDEVPTWLSTTNVALMWVYVIEMTVRIFLYRWWFFTNPVNNFDLGVVLIELVTQALSSRAFSMDLPSFAPLRLIRLLRLARGYKVLVKFPQLGLMVKGLISGTSAALYGVGLLLIILTIWGVCAVHFIHPIMERVSATGVYDGCHRCPHAFADVKSSMLTFFQQIIAGDSWGLLTMPIIEEAPETTIFFGLVFISVQFTMMNVILAVIVDSSLKASAEDVDDLLKQKQESLDSAKTFLLEICKEMDKDGSGDLTEAELFRGFDEHQEFQDILTSMDIKKEDMKVVFRILDVDHSGSVDYNEFISELCAMKQHDSHTLLVFIKYYTKEIRRDLATMSRGGRVPGSPCRRLVSDNSYYGKRRVDYVDSSSMSHCMSLEPPREEKKRPGDPEVQMGDVKEVLTPGREQFPRGEMCTLREQLGEELHHLNNVVSEELLVRVQAITRKLQMQEDDCKASMGPLQSRGSRMEPSPSRLKAPSVLPLTATKSQPWVAEESGGLPTKSATASMPESVWGIKARYDEAHAPQTKRPQSVVGLTSCCRG